MTDIYGRLYNNLVTNTEWMTDLYEADVIFFAAHSQGSIVSTELLDRLLAEGHINTRPIVPIATSPADVVILPPSVPKTTKVQRVCVLAICGIHLGPLSYLSGSVMMGPYLQVKQCICKI